MEKDRSRSGSVPSVLELRKKSTVILSLLAVLSLPILLHPLRGIRSGNYFLTLPQEHGSFRYMYQQIYERSSDIDILFLGDSLMWAAIDAPYVKGQLARKLNREVEVHTFGMDWGTPDLYYSILRQVLNRRKVKMLVMNMSTWAHSPKVSRSIASTARNILVNPESTAYHKLGGQWMGWEETRLTEGTSWGDKLEFYSLALLAAPRRILGLLRQEKLSDPIPHAHAYGAWNREIGFYGGPFMREEIRPEDYPAETLIYGESTKSWFEFESLPVKPDVARLSLISELVREYGVTLVLAFLPMWEDWNDFDGNVVRGGAFWPELLYESVPMVGLPIRQVFQNMGREQVKHFFYDRHPNANGAKWITQLFTPAFLRLYEKSS